MLQSKEKTNETFVTERTLGSVTLALLKVLKRVSISYYFFSNI